MVVLGAVSIAAGIVGRVIAPSVILDVVSFWPLYALAVVVATAVLPWRRGKAILSALLPLLWILVSGLVVALHLLGWSKLPSAAADLRGPDTGATSMATLHAELPGRLVVGAGDSVLYEVKVDRKGGTLGVPEALERGSDDEFSVDVRQRDGQQWFRTDGWSVFLSPLPRWDLRLTSPDLTADLRSLTLGAGEISGAGSISLPVPDADWNLVIDGTFTVEVPSGSLVEVTGAATVPAEWVPTELGMRSLGQGPVIAIAVTEGSQTVIKER